MQRRLRYVLSVGITLIALMLAFVSISWAVTASYTYDEVNRLVLVEYGDGTAMEYSYDSAGNRTKVSALSPDANPPVTTASPPGGTYNTYQSVTLTCNDGAGWGCDHVYYTTDGTTPTTSSPIYTEPITISTATTLKFFGKDRAGNSEAVKTETYVFNYTPSGSTLYAAFTGVGLFKYDGTTWTNINNVLPASMVASGSTLYAAFTGVGLFKYDGTTWTNINNVLPASMVASSSTLYAAFTGVGLYTYNGSTWTKINNVLPASMAAGD
jgi:YD repeat-containing protein